MKTLKSYKLSLEQKQILQIPFNSEILGVGQGGVVWAIVEDGQKLMERTFILTVEGKELSYRQNKTNYFGRFEAKSEDGGSHVLHVFEE